MMTGSGLAEFKRRMAKVPAAVRREVNAAIAKDAGEWVRLARFAAPKDPIDGTPLHDSIRHHATDTGGQVVRAGGPSTTKDGVDYAVEQEFGNQRHPAQPFYWPTYRLLKKKFIRRRKAALRKAIREASNG